MYPYVIDVNMCVKRSGEKAHMLIRPLPFTRLQRKWLDTYRNVSNDLSPLTFIREVELWPVRGGVTADVHSMVWWSIVDWGVVSCIALVIRTPDYTHFKTGCSTVTTVQVNFVHVRLCTYVHTYDCMYVIQSEDIMPLPTLTLLCKTLCLVVDRASTYVSIHE